MTGSVRRIAGRDGVVALALPARRAPRALIVPEVLPDRSRRVCMADDDVEIAILPATVWDAAYGAPAPRPGLLLDLYV